jgi:hypothetical protein
MNGFSVYTPLEQLQLFIKDLFLIRYEEDDVPENIGRVFDSREDWFNREMRYVLLGFFEHDIVWSNDLDRLKDVLWEEKFNNNNSFIENALLLIDSTLKVADNKPFVVCRDDNSEQPTDQYVSELRELAIKKLKELNEFVKSLLTSIVEKPNNNNTSETVEPIDLQISSKDAHRLIVLWELDIIDFLQKEGYSNNLIGEITALLFQQKNGKSIGSLIGKMGSDDPGSPIYGDKNMALRMTLSALKTKYRKTR